MKTSRPLHALLLLSVVAPGSAAAADFQVVYQFVGSPDGAWPTTPVSFGADGAIYGTTPCGSSTETAGVAFRITRNQGAPGWTETVIHSFDFQTDGGNPSTGLVPDGSGNFLFATEQGGADEGGAIVELSEIDGAWSSQVVHNFAATTDGADPLSLAPAPGGSFVGGALGGPNGGRGGGDVFSLVPPQPGSSSWTVTALYGFQGGSTDGLVPEGAPLARRSGAVLGTTAFCGPTQNGIVYRLTQDSADGAWHEHVLHYFSGVPDGTVPYSSLVSDNQGHFFGTTEQGGSPGCRREQGCGTVFELTAPRPGQPGWKEQLIYAFAAGPVATDGSIPMAGLIRDRKTGVLYGTTEQGGIKCSGAGCGTVFSLSPPAKGQTVWTESVLHFFDGHDGAKPEAPLTAGRDGWLYGTTVGEHYCVTDKGMGDVFRIKL